MSETFLVLRKIHRDLVINVVRCSHGVPLFLSDCNGNFDFLDMKNPQTSNFMKIRSVGSRVIPCGRTDRHDGVNIRFSQFSDPKMVAFTATFLSRRSLKGERSENSNANDFDALATVLTHTNNRALAGLLLVFRVASLITAGNVSALYRLQSGRYGSTLQPCVWVAIHAPHLSFDNKLKQNMVNLMCV